MSKVNKPLVIVGSAVLAMTTLAATAKPASITAAGLPLPPSPPRLHRPGLHRDLSGCAQAGGATEDCRHPLCRRLGPGVRPGQQGMARRPEITAGRASCLGPSRTAPGTTAATAGPRWTAPGRTSAPEAPSPSHARPVRRSPAKSRPRSVKPPGRKRSPGSRKRPPRSSPAGQDCGKGPRRGVGPAGSPGRRQRDQASECKKYFPSVGEMLPVPCTNDRSSL
jgi:hypothetical protein